VRTVLDLFCGAGGAATGWHRAGFEVLGVDINPQPHYPFEFVQADALTFPLEGFDVIHASPVCKRWSPVTRTHRNAPPAPDQIDPIRRRLAAAGVPYVIENVPEAPLIKPRILCGSMFDLDVRRHRAFEANWPLPDHHWPCRHRIWAPRFAPGRGDRQKRPGCLSRVVVVAGHGGGFGQHADDWRRAMGIDWMNREELAQAVPPVYTEWIGAQLLAHLDGASWAARR
jgi:DNA (cytosine-5)-methyltransferase 1